MVHLVVLLAICALTVSGPVGFAGVTFSDYPECTGPFVDRLMFPALAGEDEQVLALLRDEIDLIGDFVDPAYLSALESAEDIEIARTPRNGYGYLVIKANKYPFNFTDFRRAFAFALDKEAISADVWDGLSVPQDSLVPRGNPWSVEGGLPYSYYAPQVETGNYLLDRTGFLDIDNDMIRETPSREDFDVIIDVSDTSDVAIRVGEYAEQAFHALGINATSNPTDFYEYLNRIYFGGDFDMVFLGSSYSDFDVDWLANPSARYGVPESWFPVWGNATYDSWQDQLLYSTDYDEVYEAAIEMQKIWIYECPEIVCYQNVLLSAYRTDSFEGFVNDPQKGIPSWWTCFRTHHKGFTPLGGTLRLGGALDSDALNPFTIPNAPGIVSLLYDSLIIQDTHGRDIPWLAESHEIMNHEDLDSVPEGQTRITFSLVRNASWTDGTPLTAEDVAFTFNYYRDGEANPYGADLDHVTRVYSATTYEIVFEFDTQSFWHLHTIAYKPIIPKHVFGEIAPDNWTTWDPELPNETVICSGPFNVTGYVHGKYCELSRNPTYFRLPAGESTTTTSQHWPLFLSPIGVAATVASVVVIAYGGFYVLKTRNLRKSLPPAMCLCVVPSGTRSPTAPFEKMSE